MRRAPPFPQDPEFDDEAGRPSKSALKRQMHELQTLGEELTRLPDSRIAPLNLPESLLDALAELSGDGSFIAAVADSTNWSITVDYAQVVNVGEVAVANWGDGTEYLACPFDVEVVW